MGSKIKRLNFLGTPVDSSDPDSTREAIEKALKDVQSFQIVLLTLRKVLKARRNLEMQRCLLRADLILPVSKAIVRGARFQKKTALYRYNPFEFVIRILSIAEELGESVYILGAKKEDLETAERNLKTSFQNLNIVGRYSGYFERDMEKNLILAIRKASPSFLLAGRGVPQQDIWLFHNRQHFNPGVTIWIGECFEIFAGSEKNVSKGMFKLGLESLPEILRKPWKLYRFFPYVYFKLLVLFYRIRGL